jgi:two-component system, cell cycle sensor histidine kinase and response regulator CckA
MLMHKQELEYVARLTGGVARSFNNLLTVIGASASLAERAVSRGACPSAELEEVRDAVERASELTRQLSAFARRRLPLKRELELSEVLAELELPLSRMLGADQRLHLELAREPLRVRGDRGQLEQVLSNLAVNARDALSAGGTLEIATKRDGSNACVEVRDDGAGMSDEVQRHLFEPFFTTKASTRGTGLGLASCLGIVRQHDGTIQIESSLGRGTLVRIVLPLATSVEGGLTTSGVVEVAAKRGRVLVAEDEPQVRAVAVRTLNGAGFEVLEASDGARALALFKARSRPIDVLVTDVLMPELSGPELARAVRRLDPDIGVVFMSGYSEAMLSTAASEFAGAAFLAKPFAPQALVNAVRERIEQSRANFREHG